jgi:hypothetical protein
MLTVLARLTLRKTKNTLLSYFRGSVVLRTLKHIKTDQIESIASQLQPAKRCWSCYSRGERKLQLAG